MLNIINNKYTGTSVLYRNVTVINIKPASRHQVAKLNAPDLIQVPKTCLFKKKIVMLGLIEF